MELTRTEVRQGTVEQREKTGQDAQAQESDKVSGQPSPTGGSHDKLGSPSIENSREPGNDRSSQEQVIVQSSGQGHVGTPFEAEDVLIGPGPSTHDRNSVVDKKIEGEEEIQIDIEMVDVKPDD